MEIGNGPAAVIGDCGRTHATVRQKEEWEGAAAGRSESQKTCLAYFANGGLAYVYLGVDMESLRSFKLSEVFLMMKRNVFFVIFVFLWVSPVTGQEPMTVKEELVVTATRDQLPADGRPRSIEILTRKEIEESGALTVSELLGLLPGVEVNGNGSYGHATAVYLRGAKPGQAKILLDGVDISDSISTDRSVDLSAIMSANVARIEVVYGPMSSVYGTDAMAGVVNIITRSPTDVRQVSLELGSLSTGSTSLNWQDQTEHGVFWVRGSIFKTDGVSAASERYGNIEEDGFQNTSLNAGIQHDWQNTSLELNAHHIDGSTDVDDAGGPFGDNLDATFDQERTQAQASLAVQNPLGREGMSRLNVNWSETARVYDDPGVLDSDYAGRQIRANWHTRLDMNERISLAFGLEHLREEGAYEYHSISEWGSFDDVFESHDTQTDSLYIMNDVTIGPRFSATMGVRYDDHETFGGKTTGTIGVVAKTGPSHVWFHSGTSFKAPTLYQLYSPYGSTSLDPEEGTSFELGIEENFQGGRWRVRLSASTTEFEQMIDFDPVNWVYYNVGKADLKGIEAGVGYHNGPLSFRLDYAYIKTEDGTTEEHWLRRPKNTITTRMTGNWGKWTINLDGKWASSRDDMDFSAWPAERVELDAYTLANLSVRTEINDRWVTFFKVRNLTDEDYELVQGYATLGRSFYGGVAFGFHP